MGTFVRTNRPPEYSVVVLGGERYAVLREGALRALCRRAGVPFEAADPAAGRVGNALDPSVEGPVLAGRLIERRKQAGLSQAELARRAGVRVETLNRIERGHNTPDFATIRKLVLAIDAAAGPGPRRRSRKEQS